MLDMTQLLAAERVHGAHHARESAAGAPGAFGGAGQEGQAAAGRGSTGHGHHAPGAHHRGGLLHLRLKGLKNRRESKRETLWSLKKAEL